MQSYKNNNVNHSKCLLGYFLVLAAMIIGSVLKKKQNIITFSISNGISQFKLKEMILCISTRCFPIGANFPFLEISYKEIEIAKSNHEEPCKSQLDLKA